MTSGAVQPLTARAVLRLRQLTRALAEGASVEHWEDAFAQALAEHHLAAYVAGAHIELSEMTPNDWKLLDTFLHNQLEYLQGFKQAYEAGQYANGPDGAIARAALYGEAAKAPYWMGVTRGLPLPAWPGDGTTQCRTNCQCSWEIDDFGGNGNADCYWRLHPAEHCQTCAVRAEDWNPLRVRNGEVELA